MHSSDDPRGGWRAEEPAWMAPGSEPAHPVVTAVGELEAALDRARDAWGRSVPDAEVLDLLPRLQRIHSRIDGSLFYPLVAQARRSGVAERAGAGSLRSWLAGRLLLSDPAAKRLVTIAAALETDLPATAAALSAGRIGPLHCQAILEAVETLPYEVGGSAVAVGGATEADGPSGAGGPDEAGGPAGMAELAGRADEFLAERAADLTPMATKVLGRKLLEYIAPEVAEAVEERRLARAEADAAAERSLRGVRVGDRVRLSGWLDPLGWEALTGALAPLARRRPTVEGSRDARGRDQRRGDALVELAERVIAAGGLPGSGGSPVRMTVLLDYDKLAGGVSGAGMLPSGAVVPPGELRRLACDAGIIPAVLGGPSQSLDLGRERRTFTGPVRTAVALRDGGCTFPHGCDTRPEDCHTHHLTRWELGGRTRADNGTLVCGSAHWHAHHDGWVARLHPVDGLPEWVPPAWIDATRRPRRHPRLPPPRGPG